MTVNPTTDWAGVMVTGPVEDGRSEVVDTETVWEPVVGGLITPRSSTDRVSPAWTML